MGLGGNATRRALSGQCRIVSHCQSCSNARQTNAVFRLEIGHSVGIDVGSVYSSGNDRRVNMDGNKLRSTYFCWRSRRYVREAILRV